MNDTEGIFNRSKNLRADLVGNWLLCNLPTPQFIDHLEEIGLETEEFIQSHQFAFPFTLSKLRMQSPEPAWMRARLWEAIVWHFWYGGSKS